MGVLSRLIVKVLTLALILTGAMAGVHRSSALAQPPPAAAAAAETWIPDLSTLEGRLSALASFMRRHPGYLTSNLQFARNPMELLQAQDQANRALGTTSASQSILPPSRRVMTYYSEAEWVENTEKLSALRTELRTALGELPLTRLQGLTQDALEVWKSQPKQLQSFLRLAPFLYDAGGRPLVPSLDEAGRAQISRRIEFAGAMDFQNLYHDLFKEHQLKDLRAAFGSQQKALGVINQHQSKFLQATVGPATTLTSVSGAAAKPRTLSIEEIPAAFADFKNAAGGDCSALSVPHYGRAQGVKTYWIRKGAGFDAAVNGYVLVAPVKVGKQTLPYVVTINGASLSQDDARMLVKLVAEEWGATQVVVPDLKWDVTVGPNQRITNAHLVNSEPMRAGLSFESSKPVQPVFDPSWHRTAQYVNEHPSGYSNYYDPARLQHARVVSVGDESWFENRVTVPPAARVPYHEVTDVRQLRLYERGMLAALALQGAGQESGSRSEERALRFLSVSQEQLAAARRLLQVSNDHPLKWEEYQILQKRLQYTFEDLKDLRLSARTMSYAEIYRAEPGAIASGKKLSAQEIEAKWKDLTEATEKKLITELGGNGTFYEYKAYFKARMALPSEHSKIWDELPDILKGTQFVARDAAKGTLLNNHAWPERFMARVPELLRDTGIIFDLLRGLHFQSEWPEAVWAVVLDLLRNPNEYIREWAVHALQGPRVWPKKVWDLVPKLLRDYRNLDCALEMVMGLKKQAIWSGRVWPALADLMEVVRKDDFHGQSYIPDKAYFEIRKELAEALGNQPVWSKRVWALVPSYLEATDTQSRMYKSLSAWAERQMNQVDLLAIHPSYLEKVIRAIHPAEVELLGRLKILHTLAAPPGRRIYADFVQRLLNDPSLSRHERERIQRALAAAKSGGGGPPRFCLQRYLAEGAR